MPLLLETIRIENRQIRNADWHNRRMNSAREELFGISNSLDIRGIIKIPIGMDLGIYKCRIFYDKMIREVRILPHQSRSISTLKLVIDEDIDYRFKYADRSHLEKLLLQKGSCDDILIVKKGYITDTSFTNIVLQAPDGTWITPDTPLLNGTMRQFLLDEGKISEKSIRVEDLAAYTRARLINCMMDLESGCPIGMADIIP